jgi:hypothetical protein
VTEKEIKWEDKDDRIKKDIAISMIMMITKSNTLTISILISIKNLIIKTKGDSNKESPKGKAVPEMLALNFLMIKLEPRKELIHLTELME